ncbi:hypothetical protein BaRGS_00019176 [Batillaria attramentaria]|uniref:Uncharacterized protein n=1 Tax=Batillaria attramentaria TaxID=370345 RepID=A0ABD0KQL6_9CAEN
MTGISRHRKSDRGTEWEAVNETDSALSITSTHANASNLRGHNYGESQAISGDKDRNINHLELIAPQANVSPTRSPSPTFGGQTPESLINVISCRWCLISTV